MSDTDGEWKFIMMIPSNFGYLKMKDTIKSPGQMVTWLFWIHGFLRPLIFLLSWNTSDRLWFVGKDETWEFEPWTLTLEAQDFTSKWSIDLWRTLTLLARSTLGVPLCLCNAEGPKHCCIGRVWSSGQEETCYVRIWNIHNLYMSLEKFLHPPAQEWPMPMLTNFPLRFASCFLLSDLDVRLPSKLRMWKSSKRLWRTRGMTSFKGRQKCCSLLDKCGEMIAIPNLICQCKSNFPGRTHEA